MTWDESNESVRYSLYEDEIKEGWIDSQISLDASHHLCLTVACNWTFRPRPELTPGALSKWRQMLRQALDMGCAQTVRAVEEEARELAADRRRRSSISAQREHEIAAAQAAAAVDKERAEKKTSDAAAAAAGSNVTHGAVSSVRQIQVAMKPTEK